ncbi:c-type cytochrome [Roseomonas fluvialis]|uniref:Cytochrome c n=1 Tax=Roseomonas fluvialis TaxID=1750527 RepID=A0ABM7Y8N8_9PROT|nr:c-type cytochrome [Roseomonas fluvialis]BDG74347.1 cytochrome c [Roseomonas fluvialis]
MRPFPILATLTTLLAATPASAADADHGRTLFQRQCASCHQVAQPRNGVGPYLQGVVGRPAASVGGANYSPAMRQSGITWTAEDLNEFLANPAVKVRGSRMTNRVPNATDRDDLIAFLATTQAP